MYKRQELLLSNDQRRAWQQSQDVLRQAGAMLIEIDMPEIEDLRTVQSAVLPIEAATFHEPMLRERLDDYGTFMRQRILAAFAFGNRSFVPVSYTHLDVYKRQGPMIPGIIQAVELSASIRGLSDSG